MTVRDFDPALLEADFSAIQDQAGITFSMFGVSITGIWANSRNVFQSFEDQRRDEGRYTVFFLASQVVTAPQLTSNVVRAGVTYFIENLEFDAEGSGVQMEVKKSI
jgi:hypothetical protein